MTALRVHNAAIRTASVEVQTITIDGKQVTQSVFRQLRERDVIGTDGQLNGAPWGFVNYHPDECGEADSHLHVVWQHGTELFRCRVDHEVTFPRRISLSGTAEWVEAKVRSDESWEPSSSEFMHEFAGVGVWVVVGDAASDVVGSRHALAGLRQDLAEHGPDHRARGHVRGLRWRDQPTVPIGDAIALAEMSLAEGLASLTVRSLAEVERDVVAEAQGEVDRRERHRSVRRELAELPHLFIAV